MPNSRCSNSENSKQENTRRLKPNRTKHNIKHRHIIFKTIENKSQKENLDDKQRNKNKNYS